MRDPLVGSLVRRRKAAVARLEWRLEGEDTPQNVRDFIDSWLAETDIYRLIKDVFKRRFLRLPADRADLAYRFCMAA